MKKQLAAILSGAILLSACPIPSYADDDLADMAADAETVEETNEGTDEDDSNPSQEEIEEIRRRVEESARF